jgi:hypothetical protein
MAQPRRALRPDRSADDAHGKSRMPSRPGHTSVRDDVDAPCADGFHDDPGRLIESAFLGCRPSDDPETYVLAWLALLRQPDAVPRAAASLVRRLRRNHPTPVSDWHRRLIELLDFICAHRRGPRADARPLPLSNFQDRKVKS